MSKSALDYRLRRGLANRDEQMALLVQRVSGSRYENFFMPCAAGVGYSYSPYRFSKAIGALNWHFRDSGKHLMLLVPGRIGTSSPELGVPTVFSDISGFDIICEVSESKAGYMPELSYGSHIFQDLVEAGILYGAVFENEKTIAFEPEKIRQLENQLTDFYPEGEHLRDIIGIYCVSDRESLVYHDMKDEHLLCII